MQWLLDWGVVCDRGEVRKENQDAVLFWCSRNRGSGTPSKRPGTFTEDCTLVAVVADGMGGVAGGSEASQAVVSTIEEAVAAGVEGEPDEYLAGLLRRCHEQVIEEAGRKSLEGMGSTLSLALLVGRRLHLLHVGDSRCYRILPREPSIEQWSQDQNLAAELLENGVITPAEAEVHPGRHILTAVVGGDELPEPLLLSDELREEEILLLCSDGLIRVVEEKEILRIVALACAPDAETAKALRVQLGAPEEEESEPELQTADGQDSPMQNAVARLLDLANRRGSPDNVSIIAVHLARRG